VPEQSKLVQLADPGFYRLPTAREFVGIFPPIGGEAVRIWRPAKPDWPQAYAILTVDANDDVAPHHDRQMVVLRRDQRLDWLDAVGPEQELLRPLEAGSFRVEAAGRLANPLQRSLAI
jgi:hypothetical protein